MLQPFQKIVSLLVKNPRLVFAADGIGAFTTVSILFFVLRPFQQFIGLPLPTIQLLSLIAAGYFMYSAFCYYRFPKNAPPFIRAIAMANLAYCLLSACLLWWHYPHITQIGMAYFVGEILVMLIWSGIEIAVAGQLSMKRQHEAIQAW